jgi:aminoacrylate hydrolase
MPKANLGDVEIYYESHGSGDPVLLVSGLGGAASYWNPNLPAFSARYRTIVHDHRGAGQSTHSRIRYSVEQMTDDLVRLMDHLKIERAHLVGHSTGGAIGQTLALQHPERLASLVLFATWTKADLFFRKLFQVRRALLTQLGSEAYVQGSALFLYPPWWIRQNEKLVEERERLAIQHFAGVEVVASRIDAITPAYFPEELAQKIPGAKLEILSRGGHCASETVLDEFNKTVLDFLGRM